MTCRVGGSEVSSEVLQKHSLTHSTWMAHVTPDSALTSFDYLLVIHLFPPRRTATTLGTRDWMLSRLSQHVLRRSGVASNSFTFSIATMLKTSCLIAALGLLPWGSCARPTSTGDAASLHPALSSEDIVFGSVVLSEAGDWSYQDGHVAGQFNVGMRQINPP